MQLCNLHASQMVTEETDDLDDEDVELDLDLAPGAWGPHTLAGVGPGTRSVLITGEIDTPLANAICSQIDYLDRMSHAPIIAKINSHGGDVTQALAIYDTMRSVNSPIITLAQGQASSAGLLLLQGGDVRLAFKNTTLFYHSPIAAMHSNSPNMIDDHLKNYKRAKSILDETIRQRARISKRVWKKRFQDCQDAVTLTADEALELKLVDHIVAYVTKAKVQLDLE